MTPAPRLYRELLRASKSFKDKNFREFFVRTTREDFRDRSAIADPDFVKTQEENLTVLKRQAIVQNMYYSDSFSVSR